MVRIPTQTTTAQDPNGMLQVSRVWALLYVSVLYVHAFTFAFGVYLREFRVQYMHVSLSIALPPKEGFKMKLLRLQ